MVVEMLKKQYRPCEPIVLSDMKWLKPNSGALRQAFKRMSDKGIVSRYMNGVYYFPDKGKKPSVEAVLDKLYIENEKETYGYYTGYAFGQRLGVTEKTDKHPVIVTNKENSRGRFRIIATQKAYIRKPYAKITKENVKAMALLDFIREWEVYSDFEEEETFSYIKNYIKKQKIDKTTLMETAVYFPGKVSAMLLKHKLV